jgi:hypothetical protein
MLLLFTAIALISIPHLRVSEEGFGGKSLTLTADTFVLGVGESVTLYAERGDGASGKTIKFRVLEGPVSQISDGVTGSDGVASVPAFVNAVGTVRIVAETKFGLTTVVSNTIVLQVLPGVKVQIDPLVRHNNPTVPQGLPPRIERTLSVTIEEGLLAGEDYVEFFIVNPDPTKNGKVEFAGSNKLT